ncbi:MAG: serine protease [Acetatifactor sp.]|nr:serine protease [Acetatifactor sp.]
MKRFAIVIALLCLCLAGCVKEKKEQHIESIDIPESNLYLEKLHPMPALVWEDAESTNLAGLLQEQGSGMMVRLQAGGQIGSGVIYEADDESISIMTAAHVIDAADEYVHVTFADGSEAVSRDYYLSEVTDLALVLVPLADIPSEHLANYCTVNADREAFDALTAGDVCIAMGSKTGVAAEAYEGVILESRIYMEDYSQFMIWAKVNAMPGMSGGGLFDSKGHFLGILSGLSEDGEVAVVPVGNGKIE